MQQEQLKDQIRSAFKDATYPGDWCLRSSNEGDEPYLVEKEFKGKTDWTQLDAPFLDQAPEGYGSALSFLSDEAFRFYLAAYLIADIDGRLQRVEPVFHLTHGLEPGSADKTVNARRYGARTWRDEARHRFAMFTPLQCAAILAYLRFKGSADEFARPQIEAAIGAYWAARAAGRPA